MQHPSKTVLVVGAAGKKAGLVVPALARRGLRVRALIRREEQRAQVLASGAAEAVIGDLRDEKTLSRAMDGATGLFYIAPAFQADEVALGKQAVACARAAGIRRIVFSSVIYPNITAMTNHVAKLPVEEAIVESGLEYVILQPAMFYQTLAAFVQTARQTGEFAEPWSADSRLSRVDYRDVADVVAIAMSEDRLLYGTYQLAAPGWFNRHEVAELMSQVIGRPIRANIADAAKAAGAMGSAEQAQGRMRMFAWYDKHSAIANPLTLSMILGREPRTLKAFFEEMLAAS
jgi:uncharacterized protein YbjT (DUF2867 family)